MDISNLINQKQAEKEAKRTALGPNLQALKELFPDLQVKESKEGAEFLSLSMDFEGASLLSPFFAMVYTFKNLDSDALLKAEAKGLFQKLTVKVGSWERGKITISFFEPEEGKKEDSDDKKASGRRGR